MQFNALKLSGALSQHNFWVQKCKNQLFEENKRFECSFIELKFRCLQNPSRRLEKHQTLDFLLMTDFYEFFLKNLNFCNFSDIFENHQLHN